MFEKILKYCMLPRTRKEIAKFVQMKAEFYAINIFVKPLIKQGKIKLTLPDFPHSAKQKYVNIEAVPNLKDEVSNIIVTDEAILAYCNIPRTKAEIRKYFDLPISQFKVLMERLWVSGKIISSIPDHPEYPWVKVVKKNSEYLENDINRKGFFYKRNIKNKRVIQFVPHNVEKLILDYCHVPRSRQEIADYIHTKREIAIRQINILVVEGKLKMTQPEKPKNINNRFIRANVDIQILTEDQVGKFCKIPRTRREIAEKFNLLQHQATNFVKEMIKKGSLKITNYVAPESSEQLLIAPDVDHRIFTERALIEYCREPRSSQEITNHFKLPNKKMLTQYLSIYIKLGKIQRTIPNHIKNKFQKYISMI